MGPDFGSGGGSINRLKINLKESKLLLKMSGEEDYQEINNFAGRIKSTEYYQNSGAPTRNPPIPPYWAYKFIFTVEGAKDDRYNGDYLLELGESNRLLPNFFNVLAACEYSLEHPVLQFRIFESDAGYPSAYFYRNGDFQDKMEWKYSFKDDVPDRIDTGEFNEHGNPVYDYTPQDNFWKEVYRSEIYPAVNGKPFQTQRDQARVNHFKKKAQEKVFPALTLQTFPERWKGICKWMGEHLSNDEDKEEIRMFFQSKFLDLKGTGSLKVDGTIGKIEAQQGAPATETAPVDDFDDSDLPF